jgi:hypothetical protein
MTTDNLLRAVSASRCISFGTTAPFVVSRPVYVGRVGYAGIPVVGVEIVTPADTGTVCPVARQLVLRRLAELGLPLDCVSLTPSVGRGRRRKFTDDNPSSPTQGKGKFGDVLDFHFEILRQHVGLFKAGVGSQLAFPAPK